MDPDHPSEFSIALEQTPAPEPQPSPAEDLLHTLEDLFGAECPRPKQALLAIESTLDAAGDQRAAESLGFILGRLRGRHGRLLRVALLGAANMSDEARAVGMKPQNFHRDVQKLKAKIFAGRSDETTPYF